MVDQAEPNRATATIPSSALLPKLTPTTPPTQPGGGAEHQ